MSRATRHILIRSASKRDIPAILDILKETNLYFDPIDKYPEAYKAQLEHDPDSIVVAAYKGILIGVVVFMYSPLWTSVGHLAVRPQFQRQGIGTLLVRELATRVERRGSCAIGGNIARENSRSLALCDMWNAEEYDVPIVLRYLCLK